MRGRPTPRGLLLAGALAAAVASAQPSGLPEGFVHLADVGPSIRQSIRYLGPDNFLGRPVRGYEAPVCILSEPAARALAEVAEDLAADGLGLKVFDCYRPQTAVDHFVEWGRDLEDQVTKSVFYPQVEKARLFELGYIASRSGHSRGSTVDLTLIRLDQPEARRAPPAEPCIEATSASRAVDELDFGTPWDCFDELSHTEHPAISGTAEESRLRLVAAMTNRGFRNYPREWWHFTLEDEPFPDTYFDFPVR